VKHLAQFIGGPMHGLRAVVKGRYYRAPVLFGERGALPDYHDPWAMADVRVVVYELQEWVTGGRCHARHTHSPDACYPYKQRNKKAWYFFCDPALDARVVRYTAQVFCGNRIWEVRP